MPDTRPRMITRILRGFVHAIVNFLRLLLRHKTASAVTLVVIAGFYWYEIRPIVISRQCTLQASIDARQLLRSKAELAQEKDRKAQYLDLISKNMYLRSDYESFLQKCLLFYGFRISPALEQTEAAASSEGNG